MSELSALAFNQLMNAYELLSKTPLKDEVQMATLAKLKVYLSSSEHP